MIIGTAGHIDHGKTTLVKALTGVDCDRLAEEKARGITLDLGYAYTPTLGFVDVPGHEKLVHNMLAGATGIAFALLVIAADDGPMPQTREHLDILTLLGVTQGAVALTKIDRVSPERLDAVQAEIHALLQNSPLHDAPVFPVSALHGQGLDALKSALEAASARALAAEKSPLGAGFRLAVDRVFSLAGVGTVVTGTAFSGTVAVGDTLMLSPSGLSARVRSLRAQDQVVEKARVGMRIALGLVGVEKAQVERGHWLLDAALHAPVQRFDARITLLPTQPELKHWTPVHLHLGAEDCTARVSLLAEGALAPGQSGYAQLVLDRPIGALCGDRFILRDASARHTIAGGRVLDAFPPTRRRRSAERLTVLQALHDGAPGQALAVIAAQSPAGVDAQAFAVNHNLRLEDWVALCAPQGLRRVGRIVFTEHHWARLHERLRDALIAEHQRAPDVPGVERDRLRRLTLPALGRDAFDALLAEALAAGDIVQSKAWLHRPEHKMQLDRADQGLWAVLKPLLAATPFQPPRVRDVAKATGIAEETVRALLRRVARMGEAWPVAQDHFFTAEAVAELARIVAELNQDPGFAKAADLRDRIGGGRKVAIQILEFFDRVGYTRRVRDTHLLRGHPGQFG